MECRFFEEEHEYWLGEVIGGSFEKKKKLLSVTQALRKYGVSPDYANINKEVLKAKAQRGTIIHEELERWFKLGENGFTDELHQFKEYCKESGYKPLEAEKMVFNDVLAGTIDTIGMLGEKKILADYKTTARFHEEAVAYQLTLYERLLGENVDELLCFWFTPRGLKVKKVERIPDYAIDYIIEKERENV